MKRKKLSFEIDEEIKYYLEDKLPHGYLTEMGRSWTSQLSKLIMSHSLAGILRAHNEGRLRLIVEAEDEN